ncbi:EAL domain-containing protein [Treponema ruminis]|uniref:Diguanylate cyclase (GGDEF)-like protein n=1 Tax=Treponema ruminis TaxID=744515 RepID=A0A7W8LN70_9SPIR|nr:GGDEF domain-containing phosphodiesterase [Treponema ruminis]MBB5227150.1 diguanylate cyclase (GGDEF)-like protein [Treponema ruminis]
MDKAKRFFKKSLRNILKFLGITGYSDSFKKYVDRDNARSGILVSSIVMVLEFYMICYVLYHMLMDSKIRSYAWLIQHLTAYAVFFLCALLLYIFSYNFLKNRMTNRWIGKIYMIFFAVVALAFGIFISYLDYQKGEHALAFITVEIITMGIMIWRPITSISLVTGSFLLFYFICDSSISATYATQMNLFTVWLAILITTVGRFHQKAIEAKNAEHIENMNLYLSQVAVTDEATGIGNMLAFRNEVGEIRSKSEADFLSRNFLFLDILNFKSYNEKHGFDEGTRFLNAIAHTIKYSFAGEPVARFSDDHFVVFAKRDALNSTAELEVKLASIRRKIMNSDPEVKLGLKVGSYTPEDVLCHTITACDFARYACESINKKYGVDFCEYTTASAEDFARKQYVINNIDRAISQGYIQIYYQPVVLAKNKELCGFEALARWIDPNYGFMPPYTFIPVLEEYRQIHKLDAYVLQEVCRDILNARAKNVPVFPVSVNFSKIDFELMNIEELLEVYVEKQGIGKENIHIEVTESALSEDDRNLRETLHRLKTKDYSLWLDDFGSGYSGLNLLKEFEFDMMKIDMAFLKDFASSPKSRPILKNIITLAKDIGMHTLSEGVETNEAFDFLQEIGCERIQGYLFGKPMPREEVIEKIQNSSFILPNLS